MATANFKTMKDFPLYAYNTAKFEDWFECQNFVDGIESAIEGMNEKLQFHEIGLVDGYYSGIQLYVTREYDLHEDEYDNDECWYYFNCCRSVAHRNFDREIKKVNRTLKTIAGMFGFDELCVVGIFSNGEAVYDKVS